MSNCLPLSTDPDFDKTVVDVPGGPALKSRVPELNTAFGVDHSEATRLSNVLVFNNALVVFKILALVGIPQIICVSLSKGTFRIVWTTYRLNRSTARAVYTKM